MSINPFTGENSEFDIDENQGKSPIIKYVLIIVIVASIAGIAYYFRNNILTGIASANRDGTSAYLMGDPWNGKIVYSDVTSTEPQKQIFNVYDTKTEERKEFANYRIGTDPYFSFLYVGEDQVSLHDYYKYSVAFDIETANNKEVPVKKLPSNKVNSDEDRQAMEDTMAVLPKKNNKETVKTNSDRKPKKNYFYFLSGDPTDLGTGMGIEGSEEQEIDAMQLRKYGVYDFKDFGLQFSYWVYDWYARQEIIDENTGANLILVELSSSQGNRSTKSFFTLVDKKNNKVIKNGYPENTINCPGYLRDYFINCRKDGNDHILCLTRDKVLRVQISTCKITEVANW